jgi:hypothetical protein
MMTPNKSRLTGLFSKFLFVLVGALAVLSLGSVTAEAFQLQGRVVVTPIYSHFGMAYRYDCEIYNNTPYFVTVQRYDFLGFAPGHWGPQPIVLSQNFCTNGVCGLYPMFHNVFFGPISNGVVAPASCVGYSFP